MKKLYLSALAVLMTGALMTGCAKSESPAPAAASAASEATTEAANTPSSVTITHTLGTAEVPVNPKRVAVLDYSILETIDFLGVTPEIIVPKTHLPEYLKKYKEDSYADAGSLVEPNVEAINEFKPDLIIIGGRQASLYEEFSKIAPTIYTSVEYTDFWNEFERVNLMTAEIFDKKEEAKSKIDQLKTQAEEIHKTAEESGKKALVIQTNDGKISAYGPGSRFGIIHGVLGITPVDDTIEVSKHGMEIGFEYIAEKNPDLIFVVDRTTVVGGSDIASKTLDNDLVNNTIAAKDGKIIYLNPATWYLSGYGLESVPMMLTEVSDALK